MMLQTTEARDLGRLRTRLDRLSRRRRSLPPPQVLVRGPGLEFSYGDQQMPYHAASVGKVMTATLVARLVERGRLTFDTPLGGLLPAADLARLSVAPGVDPATDLTVDHLLTHTSGLPDFFDPPRGHTTAASVKEALKDPDRFWTPTDLLDEAGSLPAVGRPGERFAYGDTAYVVLGRILEEIHGEEFNALLRRDLFGPTGMTDSSTPYSDATTEGLADLRIAPFWVKGQEFSGARAMSVDWAGGGIVTTLEDQARFQAALHAGELLSRESLVHLGRPQNRLRGGIHYGAGMVTVRGNEFFPLLRGLPEGIGGLGITATHMFYYPQQQAHVIMNFHSTGEMSRSFQTHIGIARLLAQRG